MEQADRKDTLVILYHANYNLQLKYHWVHNTVVLRKLYPCKCYYPLGEKKGGVEEGTTKKLPEDESLLHRFVHYLVWHFYNKSVQNWEFGTILNVNDSLGARSRTRSCFHCIYSYLCLVVYACARMRTYVRVCKETARNVEITPKGHAKGVTGSQRLHLLYLKIFRLLLLFFSVSNKLRTVVSYII